MQQADVVPQPIGLVARATWIFRLELVSDFVCCIVAHYFSASAVAQRRPLFVTSALRVLDDRALPEQRLEGLLVFFVLLESVDIHSVVDN
jgi:hypothetical protein